MKFIFLFLLGICLNVQDGHDLNKVPVYKKVERFVEPQKPRELVELSHEEFKKKFISIIKKELLKEEDDDFNIPANSCVEKVLDGSSLFINFEYEGDEENFKAINFQLLKQCGEQQKSIKIYIQYIEEFDYVEDFLMRQITLAKNALQNNFGISLKNIKTELDAQLQTQYKISDDKYYFNCQPDGEIQETGKEILLTYKCSIIEDRYPGFQFTITQNIEEDSLKIYFKSNFFDFMVHSKVVTKNLIMNEINKNIDLIQENVYSIMDYLQHQHEQGLLLSEFIPEMKDQFKEFGFHISQNTNQDQQDISQDLKTEITTFQPQDQVVQENDEDDENQIPPPFNIQIKLSYYMNSPYLNILMSIFDQAGNSYMISEYFPQKSLYDPKVFPQKLLNFIEQTLKKLNISIPILSPLQLTDYDQILEKTLNELNNPFNFMGTHILYMVSQNQAFTSKFLGGDINSVDISSLSNQGINFVNKVRLNETVMRKSVQQVLVTVSTKIVISSLLRRNRILLII